MAMNSANDLELLSLVAKMPRTSLEAVVLDAPPREPRQLAVALEQLAELVGAPVDVADDLHRRAQLEQHRLLRHLLERVFDQP